MQLGNGYYGLENAKGYRGIDSRVCPLGKR